MGLVGMQQRTAVLPPRGLESASVTADSDSSLGNPDSLGTAKSGAVSTDHGDHDLAKVITAWDILPSAIRAGIVAMVEAAAAQPGERPPEREGSV